MHFQTAVALAADTPTRKLREVWGVGPEYVTARTRGEVPMNLREAGDLAKLHGLRLEDILGV
jgi:hypothetical protein